MAIIKRAAAEVNRNLGLLNPGIASAIIQAAQEVIEGKWDDQYVVDPYQVGAGTSQNMNTNEVIANRANQILGYSLDNAHKIVNPNDHVDMAQSTNDTIPTAIRLGVLWRLDELLNSVDAQVKALQEKASKFFEAIQSMSNSADFSASLRSLAITMPRITNDFRLMSSGPATGLDEIRLPAVQPGSSIMPGKVNPVMAEMLNMAMFQIQGCDLTVSLAAQTGQLEVNVMMPNIAHNLFEIMQVMINALQAFTDKCVDSLQAIAPRQKAGWNRKPL